MTVTLFNGADFPHFVRTLGRDKTRNVATKTADFLDEPRRNEMLMLGCHQKYGLKIAVQAFVYACHLEFNFKIR